MKTHRTSLLAAWATEAVLSLGGWQIEGAKYLIIPSRSGTASQAALKPVSELLEKSVRIMTPCCDISSASQVSATLASLASTTPNMSPIKGCINSYSQILISSFYSLRSQVSTAPLDRVTMQQAVPFKAHWHATARQPAIGPLSRLISAGWVTTALFAIRPITNPALRVLLTSSPSPLPIC